MLPLYFYLYKKTPKFRRAKDIVLEDLTSLDLIGILDFIREFEVEKDYWLSARRKNGYKDCNTKIRRYL